MASSTSTRSSASSTRERCPSLVAFFQERPLDAVEFADAWPGLLEVCCYLQLHPRPNLYARELPLSVDTKFVERHQTVLARLLAVSLPPNAMIESERFHAESLGMLIEPKTPVVVVGAKASRIVVRPLTAADDQSLSVGVHPSSVSAPPVGRTSEPVTAEEPDPLDFDIPEDYTPDSRNV